MKSKFIIMMLIAVLLSGCATRSLITPIQPSLEVIDIPKLNQVQQSELGDTIVSKGKLWTYQTMSLAEEIQSEGGVTPVIGVKITIPAGSDLEAQSEDAMWVYFEAKGMIATNAFGANFPAAGGLKLSKKDGSVEIYAPSVAMVGYVYKKTPSKTLKYKINKIKTANRPSFQQELIYNGRSGDNVKFLYRELSNDMMRLPFSQEIQYDLKESKTIGFKGVRIEVIEATNTILKYKVLSSFPDPS